MRKSNLFKGATYTPGMVTPTIIVNQGGQALPAGVKVERPKLTRAQRKAMMKATALELMHESRGVDVLGHVHPRTKRAELDRQLQEEGR